MREAILEKAKTQLMAGGYKQLNFAKIASDLETTRANLHYHFKNKETLGVEVFRQIGEDNINNFKEMRRNLNGDFLGFFSAVEGFFWQGECEEGGKVCSSIMDDPDLPESIAKQSRTIYQAFEEILAGAIQDAVDNKSITQDINVAREASRVHVLMMGLMGASQYYLDSPQAKEQLNGIIIDWAQALLIPSK